MDVIALPPLTLGCYRFDLALGEQANLPSYLGALLRGGFGITFKRLVCMQRHLERCTDCVLLHTCAYPAIFEPAPPPNTQVLRTHDNIPVPYIVEPPSRRDNVWQAGETLRFGLVLIGQGVTYLPYFVLAFQALGNQGLGAHRARATLAQVAAVQPHNEEQVSLWEEGRLRRDWAACGLWRAQDWPELHLAIDTLTLHFLTPTRLKHADHFVEGPPPFHVVVRALMRRVSSLSYFYGGQRWEVDYRGWIGRAEQVQIADAEVRWQDWERYSTRQGREMNLGGIVGRVTYAGGRRQEAEGRGREAGVRGQESEGLGAFLPLLRLGELVHVGKGAVFGNGRYEVGW